MVKELQIKKVYLNIEESLKMETVVLLILKMKWINTMAMHIVAQEKKILYISAADPEN